MSERNLVLLAAGAFAFAVVTGVGLYLQKKQIQRPGGHSGGPQGPNQIPGGPSGPSPEQEALGRAQFEQTFQHYCKLLDLNMKDEGNPEVCKAILSAMKQLPPGTREFAIGLVYSARFNKKTFGDTETQKNELQSAFDLLSTGFPETFVSFRLDWYELADIYTQKELVNEAEAIADKITTVMDSFFAQVQPSDGTFIVFGTALTKHAALCSNAAKFIKAEQLFNKALTTFYKLGFVPIINLFDTLANYWFHLAKQGKHAAMNQSFHEQINILLSKNVSKELPQLFDQCAVLNHVLRQLVEAKNLLELGEQYCDGPLLDYLSDYASVCWELGDESLALELEDRIRNSGIEFDPDSPPRAFARTKQLATYFAYIEDEQYIINVSVNTIPVSRTEGMVKYVAEDALKLPCMLVITYESPVPGVTVTQNVLLTERRQEIKSEVFSGAFTPQKFYKARMRICENESPESKKVGTLNQLCWVAPSDPVDPLDLSPEPVEPTSKPAVAPAVEPATEPATEPTEPVAELNHHDIVD